MTGGNCIPNPMALRFDDIAALNRLYPLTASNLAQFPGKQLTAPNTIALTGSVRFADGYGMQGVNVVARPLDANGNPLHQYTVTAVTGALFRGERGNPVTGINDAGGDPLSNWGSTDPSLQGAFDLSGIPLPPGVDGAVYQISFEPIDPMSILESSVGPYIDGQVSPSGQLGSFDTSALAARAAQQFNIIAQNSAYASYSDAVATAAAPRSLPTTGFWYGRLSQVGQSDWLTFPIRGNRSFTIVAQALDESGTPTNSKAMPAIGVWDGFDSPDAPAVVTGPALNGLAAGETWLRVNASADDVVRIAVADLRGDGRPDFAYNGWVLYADSIEPSHLSVSGGPIVIRGMGFRSTDTVLVNGLPAVITSISPNEITAVAPAATAGVSGAVDVTVSDAPTFYATAVISGGLSYDAGNGDALNLVTAPAGTVPINTPLPFTVTALEADLAPAGGVTVYYTVVNGTAQLGCGASSCWVTATGDGRATMSVTAIDSSPSVVIVSLDNGASLQAHFSGGTPPALTPLTPQLSVAAGASVTWTVRALALMNGSPAANQNVVFSSGSGITVAGSTTLTTNAAGIATATLTAGPLSKGQVGSIKACLSGATQCVNFTALGARPEYASLQPVSGTRQSLSPSDTPAQVVLRLLDMNGNPRAGGSVSLYQALYAWTPPCSPHMPCVEGALLASQSATAISAIDGSITFSPASLPGVATLLQGLALSGDSSTVTVNIEQH